MISGDLYQAARRSAAIVDRSDRGRIVVRGGDRATYLQGLLTNDIVALAPGAGCYAAYLTPQGRMLSDLLVYEVGDRLLLSLPAETKDSILARLDQFIFSEDVTLGDVTGTFAELGLVGPEAPAVLSRVLDATPADVLRAMPEHGNARVAVGGQPAIVARVTDIGEPGFDVYVDHAGRDEAMVKLREAGAVELDAGTAEALRIEAGVPRFGRDMDEETIPLEAGIEARAISFTKGCYVGQEVIIRVLHRGHGRVARKLVGLTLDAGPPPPGSAVNVEGREIGKVTSSTLSPALKQPIALAYVHRDFVAPGTVVSVAGARGVVTDLPFVGRKT